MNSPEEIQLADDLRRLVAGPPFTPDIVAIERRARRQRQRGLAIRGLAGMTMLGLAVAVAAIAAPRSGSGDTGRSNASGSGGHSGDEASAAGSASTAIRAKPVAYVRQEINAALNPADYLIETRQRGNDASDPSSAVTIWTDPTTGNTMLLQGSGADKVSYWEHDYYQSRVLHWDQTQVNYGPRTWWTYDMNAGGPIQGPAPSGPVGGDYTPAVTVKAMLAKGDWKIAGYPVVDGHHTVELSFSKDGLTEDIWADTQTYEVVRMLRRFPGLPPVTADYYWVPRSAAMTNLINHPKIPAGFTQVPAD